jgi:hypothetical protein
MRAASEPNFEHLEHRQLLAADLTCSILQPSGGGALERGVQYGGTVSLANIGDALPSGTRVRVQLYVTQDTSFVLSRARALAGASATFMGGLASGDTTSESFAYVIPNDLVGGNWRLFAWADPERQAPETNRANNISSGVAFTLPNEGSDNTNKPAQVDLTTSVTMLSSSLTVNQPVRLSVTIANTGPEALGAAGTFAQIYRTRGTTANPQNDTLIGDAVTVTALGAGQSVTREVSFTLPESESSGAWRFYAVVDGSNQTVETNDTNNVSSLVTGLFNYVVRDVSGSIISTTLPSEFVQGQKFSKSPSIKYSIRNSGDATFSGSSSMSVRVALRPLGASDASTDIRLASPRNESLGGLAAGASRLRDWGLSVPTTLSAGMYRLILSLDDTGKLDEVNETNNLLEYPTLITVRPQTFDPAITGVTLAYPTTIKTGVVGKVSLTLGNLGNTTFKGSVTVQFYFLDASGTEVSSTNIVKKVELRTDRALKLEKLSVKAPAVGTYSMGVRLVLDPAVSNLTIFNDSMTIGPVTVTA